jgi:hypothetical protein
MYKIVYTAGRPWLLVWRLPKRERARVGMPAFPEPKLDVGSPKTMVSNNLSARNILITRGQGFLCCRSGLEKFAPKRFAPG